MSAKTFQLGDLPATLADGFVGLDTVIDDHAAQIDQLAAAIAGGGVPTGAMVFNVVTGYGAVGDGVTVCNTAFANALTAAYNWVQGNGTKHAVIYIPAGKYAFNRPSAGVRKAIDLGNRAYSKITFLGDGDERSILYKADDALNGTFNLCTIGGSSSFPVSDIMFRNLTFDGSGESNPDNAVQNHLFSVQGWSTDIRFFDCVFRNSIGDAIQQVGSEGGGWVSNVWVNNCRFYDCARSGTEFQRYVRFSTFSNCYFKGGTDQMIDFEPTGFTDHKGDLTGCTSTVLKDALAHFVTGGWQVGQPVKNQTENRVAYVVSVDSETQITTTPVTDWTGDTYFEYAVYNPMFVNCTLDNLAGGTGRILWTLGYAYKPQIVGCRIINGTIQAVSCSALRMGNSTILSGTNAQTDAAISLQNGADECSISDCHIICRSSTRSGSRDSIACQYGNGMVPSSVTIRNVHVRAECRSVVRMLGVSRVDIDGLTVINASSSTDVDVAILISSLFASIDSVNIRNFRPIGEQSRWLTGVSCTVDPGLTLGPVDIHATIRPGDCKYALEFVDGGVNGTITTPPAISGALAAGTALVHTWPATPWLRTSSADGLAASYIGTGSPNTVLSAPQGSIAQRTDGGAGTTLYVRETGAATNWTAK